MDPVNILPILLAVAWLLPLVSFAIISMGYSVPQLFGTRASYASAPIGGYVATGAIVASSVLSFFALLFVWLPAHPLASSGHHGGHGQGHTDHAGMHHGQPRIVLVAESAGHEEAASAGHEGSAAHPAEHDNNPPPKYYAGDWYSLCNFGDLKLTIGYYIDTLTVVMFCVVTLIASCVHFYAMGYMHDELHDFTDPEVEVDGEKFRRPGRYYRFFQYLSLFCFSMLGIVIAGNLAMVFVFWELVGICSYFLIGFYIERKSASNAANKAFIVNRVGDFGMLIGLMALWASLGTFAFGDKQDEHGNVVKTESNAIAEPGIFSLLRTEQNGHALAPADGMIALAARDQIAKATAGQSSPAEAQQAAAAKIAQLRSDSEHKYGHWLLFVAGVGLFCGCVGKSAQFPLHVWLPDAMEGPTPVSALVHSATMVAAGVFLVGRAYPIFTPEALLVIATAGLITLFVAATIAVTQVDIKRVLAYSTVSQLGYMMLALGLGGWVAGLFHLVTHAFFKGLLFLCSGSVIHAVHTNDMREMGGLRKKMPITAYTMLVGCLAIAGVGVPFLAGFSGFHSKDAIVEQAFSHWHHNWSSSFAWIFFVVPIVGAAITAFYMFRLWYMTFAGQPRDHHRYDHAHESPGVMTAPLVLLAVFALVAGWSLPSFVPGILSRFGVQNLLEQARPVGTLASTTGTLLPEVTMPSEHIAHAPEMFRAIKLPAGLSAITAAIVGILLATMIYLWQSIRPASLAHWLRPLYDVSWHKWWFDELYHYAFVLPALYIGRLVAALDLGVIDSILHFIAWTCRQFANIVSFVGDRTFVDGFVDNLASKTWSLGVGLRTIQTGRLRQYVMFIVVGTIVLFVAASIWRAV